MPKTFPKVLLKKSVSSVPETAPLNRLSCIYLPGTPWLSPAGPSKPFPSCSGRICALMSLLVASDWPAVTDG